MLMTFQSKGQRMALKCLFSDPTTWRFFVASRQQLLLFRSKNHALCVLSLPRVPLWLILCLPHQKKVAMAVLHIVDLHTLFVLKGLCLMVFFIAITVKYAHVPPFRIVMKVLAFIPSKSGVFIYSKAKALSHPFPARG